IPYGRNPLINVENSATRPYTVEICAEWLGLLQGGFAMIGRGPEDAGIKTKIGCHTFRATGITAYLRNGGRLEIAQQIAAHESSRTTDLYDRRGDDVSLD